MSPMSDEARDALRLRNAMRPVTCRRCGGLTETRDGKDLNPETHFPEMRYKVCRGCGHEEPLTSRRPRRGL